MPVRVRTSVQAKVAKWGVDLERAPASGGSGPASRVAFRMSDITANRPRAAMRGQDVQRPAHARVEVRGKFLFVGERKLYLRGVTYGTFAPHPDRGDYPPRQRVEQDFAAMAAASINAVRVYTVPPTWLLDLASRYGLRVMVGLPWEQH